MNSTLLEDSLPRYANIGYGPQFAVFDIGLPDRVAVVEPDKAFWALVEREALPDALSGKLVQDFHEQADPFQKEMDYLRFGLKPSAVYFNPTERCNFNCAYCYLPEPMRKTGKTMTADEVCNTLEHLLAYFRKHLPEGVKPQLIFHGSEPMMAREAMFSGIERFQDDFIFGMQTNATLLDEEAVAFLTKHNVGIGISLDAPTQDVADLTRKNWNGEGSFSQIEKTLQKLNSYPAFNVITTVTKLNVHTLPAMVEFYAKNGIQFVMFNPVRCTQKGGQELKPDNEEMAQYFCQALDMAYNIFQKTGHKVVITNFANVLAGIAGPTTRRLMCDISPCGGGRCFFAVSAEGDVFPCSEFIGFPAFKGGNLFQDDIPGILKSSPFTEVTKRKVENIVPCSTCAIRNFCGAPCPAEVHALSGTVNAPSPYCQFYEEQVRYAFRVIAEEREEAFLWDGWQDETEESFCWA